MSDDNMFKLIDDCLKAEDAFASESASDYTSEADAHDNPRIRTEDSYVYGLVKGLIEQDENSSAVALASTPAAPKLPPHRQRAVMSEASDNTVDLLVVQDLIWTAQEDDYKLGGVGSVKTLKSSAEPALVPKDELLTHLRKVLAMPTLELGGATLENDILTISLSIDSNRMPITENDIGIIALWESGGCKLFTSEVSLKLKAYKATPVQVSI